MSVTGLLRTIRPEPLTAEAFAPYGAVLEAPDHPGDRRIYTPWLGSKRDCMSPRLHVNHVPMATLPHTVSTLERHPNSAQIFIPLDVARYLILVTPTAQDGSPLSLSAGAFLAPGNVGILYAPGVWHASATVLDKPGSFSVLMWRNDSEDDEEYFHLSEQLQVNF